MLGLLGGQVRNQPGHLIDVMATCLELSGAKYPAKVGENAVTSFEGKSLVPAFAAILAGVESRRGLLRATRQLGVVGILLGTIGALACAVVTLGFLTTRWWG